MTDQRPEPTMEEAIAAHYDRTAAEQEADELPVLRAAAQAWRGADPVMDEALLWRQDPHRWATLSADMRLRADIYARGKGARERLDDLERQAQRRALRQEASR